MRRKARAASRANVTFPSLVDLLGARADERPEVEIYTFLAAGEEEAAALTRGQLAAQAKAVAACLQAFGLGGERALLLYPPGLEFITAFFGCLCAGVVAVPAYPPRSARMFPRLRAIAADARPRVVLTTGALLESLAGRLPELAGARWIASDEVDPAAAGEWRDPAASEGTLAFLQYTSGSTAQPKGVRVSHGNLLHNGEMIRRAFGQSERSVVAGWLPLYHDMGLIGNVLQPLYAGGRCVLMSPVAFLQRPVRWLKAISDYRATTSGGPNFAYDLCARKIEPAERNGLDLSTWEVAFNGAEPVRPETLDRFTAAFAACGFRREAFHPCYGLAEATLFVTGGAAGRGPRVDTFRTEALELGSVIRRRAGETGRRLVSCGGAWLDQEVVIADPENGRRCPRGGIGEIWVSGPSVAEGYWGQPEATARDFGARLAGEAAGPFLRTGDLGFLSGGELYVTGRIKDLIILRGRNHYPQDIEATTEESHPALRPGCSAAFACDDGGVERLVVVQEIDRRREEEAPRALEAVRRAVAEVHEVQVHEVALVRAGTVPKTSSGKIQRSACRAAYQAGELVVVARSGVPQEEKPAPVTEIGRAALLARPVDARGSLLTEWLRDEAARVLGVSPSEVAADRPLTALGLDSLSAVELRARIEQAFEVPVGLAPLLEGASAAALAGEVLARLAAGPQDRPTLQGPETGDFPLAAGQRSLWLLHRLEPESLAYVLAGAARVRGDLDPAAFVRAVEAMVERHPALRTTFGQEPAGPFQRVHARLAPQILLEDATGLSPAAVAVRVREIAWRPFDLATGPLFRVAWLQVGPGEDVLVFAVHHIVCDFWSAEVMARELAALLARPEDPLPPLPLRLTDCSRWWQERLAGPAGERLWHYWSHQLADGLPPLELVADRPRPAVQTWAGGARNVRISPEFLEPLRSLARERGSTLYMALVAGFQALLGRYAAQERFAIGSPTAGRPAENMAGLVGYFVNPVVLRAELAGDPPFRELLERTRVTVLAALEHQDFPFPLLAERLATERDPSRSPLFDVMFAFEKERGAGSAGLAGFALGEGGASLSLGGLELETLALTPPGAAFDLSLMAAEMEGGLGMSLRYNSGLFDAVTAERMLSHLRTLLAGATESPATPLSELPLLESGERRQLLEEFNRTALDHPRDLLLHELFLAQAERTPEAVALVAGGERLTYAGLAAKARRMADRLRAAGVGPEVPVGVCLHRTPTLVATLLGTLEAGGFYVPLDPDYPAERLRAIVEDSRAAIVATEERCLDALPATTARIVRADREDEALAALPLAGEAAGEARALQLAYTIYTSGSTGRPKGIAISHRNAVALAYWAREVFQPAELAGVLGSTSICFDISVFELFVTLAWGGTLILVENALAFDELPAQREVTLINTVPSAMSELLRLAAVRPGVRTVNLAGEPLRGSLARRVLTAGSPRLYNLYGPSEDTTYSTCAAVSPEGEPTIGRPVANTRAYILDRGLRLAPVGVPGELHLSGEGVSRGYLGRPEMTAERYLPDPFAAAGTRMYRTGDLARWRRDGELEYLGRLDHQVKLRGFRIELGEIETVLLSYPDVRAAAVILRETTPGDSRLVAFVAPATVSSSILRAFLARQLPNYMVPAAVLALDALPLLPNGKVDRRALARLPVSLDASSQAAGAEAPRNPVEEILCGLWCELLGRERVGRREDFFALGGHSLLATQLASRIREAFGVELPLQRVFAAPTVANLAAVLRDLKGTPAPPIRPVAREGDLPLSFAQERLWFLDRLAPGSPLYNMPAAAGLRGGLSPAALAAACAEIVRRHQVLRTAFGEAGRPVQRVVSAQPWALPIADLSALPGEVRDLEARRLAAGEAARPFDLTRPPQLRTTLLRLDDREHLLLATLHHIVADGWSVGVLMRELAALYAAARTGAPSPLAEPVLQYTDFALWQSERLRGEVLESHLSYWRQALAGAPEALDLPVDRPRPAVHRHRGNQLPFRVPLGLTAGLRALARREGLTPFMLLLAGFQALLSRLSRQLDVIVGSPIANRNRLETEGLIGLFVNTLALRLDLSADPTPLELGRRSRETTLRAYAHQDLPFEKLVAELAPARDPSRTPLFQVLFALQSTAPEALSFPGLQLEVLPLDAGVSKFDLSLSLDEGAQGWAGFLEYSTDLFEAVTVERWGGHLLTLLAGMAAAPERRLSELPLLSAAELEQIQRLEGGEAEPVGAGELAHERFAGRAQASPDAVALEVAGERLTYGELERRSDRLARRLASLGVGREVVVGLCLERSVELVASLLAVWKAGGAWVPLDPSHPAERLAYLLADSGAQALITVRRQAERLTAGGLRTVLLDEESGEGLGPVDLPSVSPGDLAYLIYTSGSTGRPKGVQVEHGSLAVLLRSACRRFGLEAGERWPVVAPSSFDIFLFELLAPLLSGGTAVLVPLSPALDVAALVGLLEGATRFHAVPALMRSVAEEARAGERERFGSLRTLLTGGDAVPAALLRDLRAVFPRAELAVLYGPTEATCFCTVDTIPAGRPAARSLLGVPLAGARVELRDPFGNRVPLGVAGEIWIAGAGVARGYAGLEELTAARFPVVEGRRTYRSGDLARRLADGNLEFLGRVDQQVKIRGFRIEPAEIEAVLAGHPEVRQAAVVAREDGGERRLVAYVEAVGREGLPAELRERLRARLPEYMLPAAIVALESLPLTAHGKLDRLALPAPQWERAAYVAPRTPAEELLASLWSEVLGVEQVGATDDFFALGGHSLLATQLASRVRSSFGVELPLRRLFEQPTVAALARLLQELAPGAPQAPPIRPVPRDGSPLPLSFAQQRLWFLDQLEPGNPTYNLPLAIRLSGTLDRIALERALAEVIERHEALRTRFSAVAGEPVQVVQPGVPLALEIVVLTGTLTAREASMLRLASEEALRPFDLEQGPLVRARLLHLDDVDHVLLLTVHHIVADGWSMGILVREVAALYEGYAAATPAALPRLPLQYADFAVWQRRWLAGEVLESEIAWWRDRLAGAQEVLDLPADRPRPAVKSSRGALCRSELAGDLPQALQTFSRQSGSTLFMTLFAGLAALLHRYTGQDDLLVGSPVANRTRVETEPLIGFFVNTLVMRADLTGDPPFARLSARIREAALDAYAHQDLPFEKVVEAVRPLRDLSRSPLFQVAFALQNLPVPELRLAGLTLSPVPTGSETVKFDWDVAMEEKAGAIRLRWAYNIDLFDGATIERAVKHLQTLLAGAAAEPGRRVSDLPLLSLVERKALLAASTRPLEYPALGLIHERVAAQAAKRPAATALVLDGQTLTYGRLEAGANRLAHRLRRLGVGPETVVGICLERSFDLVEAMLAVLKAGGAYLPLDPGYPRERLQLMLRDSSARVLLARSHHLGDLQEGRADLRCLALDHERESLGRESGQAPEAGVEPDHPAYVIYTSGSTGRPKGVVISHRALANRLGYAAAFDLGPDDAFLQKTSVSFDVSVLEIFGPLAVGGRSILVPPDGQQDVDGLLRLMAEQGVTQASFPPSLLYVLLERDDFAAAGRWLRTVITGGEVVPADLPERFFRRLRADLLNRYGPTEATISVTSWTCQPGVAERVVPIGQPIGNAGVQVLDRWLNPVPLGLPGELFLGGVCLARGYLGRPDLTAERFMPDPFASAPGERLYRTGDLVRLRPDGALEFLGRVDGQVKIRGFRVELGDVEAALAGHPCVREIVVADREQRVAGEAAASRILVAYVVPEPVRSASGTELREYARAKLPPHMVPSAFVTLERLPLGPTGKVDRRALPAPDVAREPVAAIPRSHLEQKIAAIWQDVLGIEHVGLHDNFFDLGGHSLLMARVHDRLRQELSRPVSMVDLFQFPTVAALAGHLDRQDTEPARREVRLVARRDRAGSPRVAIVGMAGRFPGAANVPEFWRNLCAGVEAISFFSDAELRAEGIDPALLAHPRYVKAGGALHGGDLFDAEFFGYSHREAELMDPQHRIFLECAWEALENAGYDPAACPGKVGVYAGTSFSSYLRNLAARGDLASAAGSPLMGNDKDFVATRVSYKLDLRGPSFTVQTACSTSLVAVHLACQALLGGECDLALAGAASIGAPLKSGYVYEEGGIHSPDGHCRAFDAEARGTVRGNGVGIVVLKRLEDALAAGDRVYAVILGTALNNDGAAKVGYTAPGVDGQAAVIADAQTAAGVGPAAIGYLEAHGTGTRLGDPVEVAALNQAFAGAAGRASCALGSVKTNIGHLDAAAGVAGLIKSALAVQNGLIPPSLHFARPNPEVDFGSFFVNTELRDWPRTRSPRRAGISSFGIGGTNAHVVIEEPPPADASGPSRPIQLLLLSARSESALDVATRQLADHLEIHPQLELADVAYTLQVGRHPFAHRRVVVCHGNADALPALRDPRRWLSRQAGDAEPRAALLFPGQGAQHVNMGRGLYEREAVFREHVDLCCGLLARHLELDLRAVLYPAAGEQDAAKERLTQTGLAQPALFVIESALAKLWMSWGLRPGGMLGHSLGEYVAAYLSGVFSLEDALAIVAARGELMQGLPPGAMLAVPLPAVEIEERLGPELSLAAVNAPSLCVVSGPEPAIAALRDRLAEKGTKCRRLVTSHAFHSAMMDPVLAPFEARLRQVRLSPPTLPWISNLTGTWIRAEEATDPAYWVCHLRATVRFCEGLEVLLADPGTVLLETGPGDGLTNLARRQAGAAAGRPMIASMRHPQAAQDDLEVLLGALGRLWLAGARPDWAAFHAGERRRRVELPTYPFERQRYWVMPGSGPDVRPRLERRADPADWIYAPGWKRVPPVRAAEVVEELADCLLFLDPGGVGAALALQLVAQGQRVATVLAADRFARLGDGVYTIDPSCPGDYASLLADLQARGWAPRVMVHLWSVTAEPITAARAHELGLYSTLFLAQAIGRWEGRPSLDLVLVSNLAHQVTGGDEVCPEKAMLLGPCRAIPREYPQVSCRWIDLDGEPAEALSGRLVAELEADGPDALVAYRFGHRWVRTWEPLRRVRQPKPAVRLREGGVYLVTGGLGGIGLALAGFLAREARAKLILISRSALPPREDWPRLLAEGGEMGERIRRFQDLETDGTEVLVLRADVCSPAEMAEAVRRGRDRFGSIHGAVHAAGVPGGGMIQLRSRDEAAAVLAPKVEGTRVLAAALAGEPLDFLALCSSLATVAGGFGNADYVAANAFLDAFAEIRRPSGGPAVLSIAWDAWRQVGMAARAVGRQDFSAWGDRLQENGILPEEGWEVMRSVLASGLPRAVVSTRDLESLLSRADSPGLPIDIQTPLRAASSHPRPQLAKPFVAPRSELERRIAGLWQDLLGVEPVGLHDSFFELGGHSLLATQLISQVRDLFGAEVSFAGFFDDPTVAGLAGRIEGQQARAGDEELAQMMTEIKQLSAEELQLLLAAERQSQLEGEPL